MEAFSCSANINFVFFSTCGQELSNSFVTLSILGEGTCTTMSRTAGLLLAIVACALAAKNAFPAKQLAGPPTEFAQHRLPE